MSNIKINLQNIQNEIAEFSPTLVAVSKTKPLSDLKEAYDAGQRVFGENKVQELCEKQATLPKDIEWHMIGHLQTNKVKFIASFITLIHAVDSEKLLKEINKQGEKNSRKINCLLQVHIAEEETKFGFSIEELTLLLGKKTEVTYPFVNIIGLMGMATNTPNTEQIIKEFKKLHTLYTDLKVNHDTFHELSMGMSGDYQLALQTGSTMIRVGSAIFGKRNYTK